MLFFRMSWGRPWLRQGAGAFLFLYDTPKDFVFTTVFPMVLSIPSDSLKGFSVTPVWFGTGPVFCISIRVSASPAWDQA